MMTHLLVFILKAMIWAQAFGADSFSTIHSLANNTMDVVTHSKDYPLDGHFKLSTTESDLVLGVGKNDQLLSEYAYITTQDPDCNKKKIKNDSTNEEFEKRKWRMGAIWVSSPIQSQYETNQSLDLFANSFESYIENNDPIKFYSGGYFWSEVMGRFKNYDPNADVEVNSKKLSDFLMKEASLNVPKSILISEFIYRDLLTSPNNWKTILEKSKDKMSFDEKVKLVARLGGDFGNDYNYDRAKDGSSSSKGVIPIEVMLKNLSSDESGGICRDVSLAQTQMLKALGVNQSYSIGYNTIDGGHAVVLAIDPNDKNRVYKFNYGSLYTDNGKKGAAVLDQDSSLPNVGINYRIYDNQGRGITVIPTEVGAILKEMTNQQKRPGESARENQLRKVYVTNGLISGNLFNGRTSTGEEINGLAISGKSSETGPNIFNGGLGLYQVSSEKTYYSLNQEGLYGFLESGKRPTLFEGKYGKFQIATAAQIELIAVKSDGISKITHNSVSGLTGDIEAGFYVGSSYDLNLSNRDKISTSARMNMIAAKTNVADEGSRRPIHESTYYTIKYEHEFDGDLKGAIEWNKVLARYGNNVDFKASLTKKNNAFFVEGNKPFGDAPSFFSGQQRTISSGYEKNTKSGWKFILEYENNLDSKEEQVRLSGEKKF